MPRVKAIDAVFESVGADESPVSDPVEEKSVGRSFERAYTIAAAPFEKTHKRQIRGGRMLDYITGEQATSRMQEAYLDYDWSVGTPQVFGTDIIVSGTMTVKCGDAYVSRSGFGGSQIKSFGGTTDLANDIKAAETSAFKRAASKFGVGLYLYEKDEEEPQQEYTQSAPRTQAPSNLNDVRFPTNNSNGTSTSGVIERKSANGIMVNGQWYNVSKFAPIDLGPWSAGMPVTIAHAPGKTFIDGLTGANGAPAADLDDSEDF